MEHEGSLPCSQQPAPCPYPEPHKHSPHSHIHFLNRNIHKSENDRHKFIHSNDFKISHLYHVNYTLHHTACPVHTNPDAHKQVEQMEKKQYIESQQ